MQLSPARLSDPRLLRGLAYAIVLIATVLAVSAWRPSAADRAAAVTATDPADEATLAQAPAGVELAFTAAPDPQLSHVSVRDASGTELDAGRLGLVGPQRLRQPIRASAAGAVAVAYHVTFTDGRDLAGVLRFSIGTESSSTAASSAAASSAAASSAALAAAEADVAAAHNATHATGGHQHGVDPVSAALLAVDGIVVLAVVVLLLRRPPPRRPLPGDGAARDP